MPGIELGKEREQLWPEMKEKPQMLEFCCNAVGSNTLYRATSELYRLHEGRIVRATGETGLMEVSAQVQVIVNTV